MSEADVVCPQKKVAIPGFGGVSAIIQVRDQADATGMAFSGPAQTPNFDAVALVASSPLALKVVQNFCTTLNLY